MSTEDSDLQARLGSSPFVYGMLLLLGAAFVVWCIVGLAQAVL